MGKYKAFDKRSTKNVTKAGLRLKSIEMNMKKSAIRKAALAEGLSLILLLNRHFFHAHEEVIQAN